MIKRNGHRIILANQITGAMIPPGGGRQPVFARLQSKFILIAVGTRQNKNLRRFILFCSPNILKVSMKRFKNR
jgi:hypothetical protein